MKKRETESQNKRKKERRKRSRKRKRGITGGNHTKRKVKERRK